MKERLAVIIPTYNRRDWLIEAIESVLQQEMPADQLIVIDDGSEDGTEQALERYRTQLTYQRQARGGAAAAKNRGVSLSDCSWVQFLDADDRLKPHATSRLRAAIAGHPTATLLAYRAEEMDRTGRSTGQIVGKRSPGDRYTTQSLLERDAGGCSWFAVRRDAFNAVGRFDAQLRSAEECDLVLKLSFHGELWAIDEALIDRRMHEAMLSADRALNARCWIQILERLRASQPEWVRAHQATFNRSWGKEHLRLGKSLLNAGEVASAREALAVATRYRPWNLQAWVRRFSAAFSASRRSSST